MRHFLCLIFPCVSLAPVGHDLFQLHQLLLIKGNGRFLEFSHPSPSWPAGDMANPGGRLYSKGEIPFLEPESHTH